MYVCEKLACCAEFVGLQVYAPFDFVAVGGTNNDVQSTISCSVISKLQAMFIF